MSKQASSMLFVMMLVACTAKVDGAGDEAAAGGGGGAPGGGVPGGGHAGDASNTAGMQGGVAGTSDSSGGAAGEVALSDASVPDAMPARDETRIPSIVAVGYGTFRIRSLDGGKTWIDPVSTRDAPTSADMGDILRDVTFGNGLYVAVGPTVFTSVDGAKWVDRGNPIDTWMGGVAHGNGLYIVAGWGGRYAYSSDAITWTMAKVGTANLRSAAAGGGQLAVAGDDSAVMVSTDAKSWTRLNGVYTSQVAYCRGAFHKREDCLPSFGNGVYLRPDGAAIERSLNGTTWQRVYDGKNRFYWVGSVFAFGDSPRPAP